jgi:hypothetical protein
MGYLRRGKWIRNERVVSARCECVRVKILAVVIRVDA